MESTSKQMSKFENGELSFGDKLKQMWTRENIVEKPTEIILGSTRIDITTAVKELKYSKNSPTFIVMLVIRRSLFDIRISFFEIKSDLQRDDIIEEFFDKMICRIPREWIRRNRKASEHRKYFGKDEESDQTYLKLSEGRAYIYVGEKWYENEHYENNYGGMINFTHRSKKLNL